MSKNSYLAALTLLMASTVALSACNQEETTPEELIEAL